MSKKEEGMLLVESLFKQHFVNINKLLQQEDDYRKSVPQNEKLYWLTLAQTEDIYIHFPREVFIRKIKARKFGYDLFITEKEWKNILLRAIGLIPVGDEFNYAGDLHSIKINAHKIKDASVILNENLTSKIPGFNYEYFITQLKIDFNDKILFFFKKEFSLFKNEINNISDINHITKYTSSIITEIERCYNAIICDAANFNFVRISLDQLSHKIQDQYSDRITALENKNLKQRL